MSAKNDHTYYLSVKSTPRYKEQNRQHSRAWRKAHPSYESDYAVQLKIEVLSHYGPQGRLQCNWPECEVTDVDMLSLDHVQNDGAQDRRSVNRGRHDGGTHIYHRVRKADFPDGFQTLCHNHQWKKELMRRREQGKKKEN